MAFATGGNFPPARDDPGTVMMNADRYTLVNGALRAVLTNLGARLLELHVPDRDGALADIVLGRPDLETSASDETYMGSTAGRYANRIRGGRLSVDGRDYALTLNEGENHLHGGVHGFDKRLWRAEHVDEHTVRFHLESPDGDQGYPGALAASVTYALGPDALSIDFAATTDAPTVVNLVHHSYFNLGGHDSGTVLDHVLRIDASAYLPVDDDLLPTGEVRPVDATPFDFRTPKPIGRDLGQVRQAGAGRTTADRGNYDHNWVLDGTGTREVVVLTDPASGRRLTLSSDQPGVQVYSGGYLAGVTGKAPVERYPAYAGVTLETQLFPDSPHHPHFPSAEVRPGDRYTHHMRLAFDTVGR
ncbi:aldose 1-epimerase [Virgisporangium aliadipatigenens]|uniref:Aldose 1-epimerase n=1 Tax=Virgisporangium aliadipatigenens TaxID=741659 RepID=A0A8J3YGX6_9ACTN|nr:aldose epimerase family protein [Virgisporangium aliadipatigenens]GIJ43800.1 aldose 1-epimerase [Virgisporangium aliadipatigenens]